MSHPFVSVITPTYNRRRFLPYLIQCYLQQTYPKERMEWIILDDGEDCVKDVFDEAVKVSLSHKNSKKIPTKKKCEIL